jgi:site-specific DNA-methyltransferase (adenine-specific)
MKFDVIVGNPPYQIEDDGHGRSASPLYHEFVQQAIALDPSFVLMVVPSRWMGGGKGLDDFRKSMLGDRRMNVLVDFQDSRSVFPSVDIAGGICYFLWQRDHDGPCRVVSDGPEGRTEELRDLSEFDVVIRGQRALQIVRKVRARASSYMSAMVSARKPFGLDTTARPRASGELTLRWQNGEGPFPRSAVTAGAESIDRWKVVASYAGFDHAGAPDKDGRRRVLSVVTVLPPGTICNETYLVIGAFDTRAEAESLRSYMLTRFFRFLLSQRMFSQHLTRTVYSFVPQQTWDRAWTDEALYAAYGLDAEDRSHIEASIREMPA